MLKERKCKEIKLNLDNNFNIKYGTFNKYNPQSIYIIGRAWIKPISDDFTECIDEIKNSCLKNKLQSLTNSKVFLNKSIINIDLAEKRMNKNKESLLQFEIHLLQSEEKKLNDFFLIEDIKTISNDITNTIQTIGSDIIEIKNKR
jgi:hypothetical protein